MKHHSTLAMHVNYGFSSGGASLPYNNLFSLTDQQLRNTTFVFYGDREILGQAELRIPVTQTGNSPSRFSPTPATCRT